MASIPKSLPNCELIKALARKAEKRKDTEFSFLAKLDDFRSRVCKEMEYIKVLFPEYTPHDEANHLSRLFHFADKFLGTDLIREMNAAELFVLAAGLYGHDWGMAVSEAEKEHIISGKLPKGKLDFLADPTEHVRFLTFAKGYPYKIPVKGRKRKIDDEFWRAYVRETHAERSGRRVRDFFTEAAGGIGEAIYKLCVGHALDLEKLHDDKVYPINSPVTGESINVRALTVYLRLIDLLDLSSERTPYVIWKFVAPRNKKSGMEWKKHLAVHSVACTSYGDGGWRSVLIGAKTDSHEVYASLEDLRTYVDRQFQGCLSILLRMNDKRHVLKVYHINWKIDTDGFRGIPVQFEFDRPKILELLGEEIYQGDPYVFLRELLQNSIDAIRARREMFKKQELPFEDFGSIHVCVEHARNGDATITWTDDGIGMDEFVVKNYLAVVGKSYYGSDDFEKQGIPIDPISQFGIGILSCFVVAQQVEIITFKDANLLPESRPLRILIEDPLLHFRVEEITGESPKRGTTVKVFVDHTKTKKAEGTAIPLRVTDYLKVIAGFVEFPIYVEERGEKTVILHPRQDRTKSALRFPKGFQICQLDLGCAIEDVVYPQDVPLAINVFESAEFDVATDLHLQGYEGSITFIIPKKWNDAFKNKGLAGESWRNSARFVENSPRGSRNPDLLDKTRNLGRSAQHSRAYAIYRDGILLSNAPPPRNIYNDRKELPAPRMVLNLSKSKSRRIDVARTEIIGNGTTWYDEVYEGMLKFLQDTRLKGYEKWTNSKRLTSLSYIHSVFHIKTEDLWRVVDPNQWPVPTFTNCGKVRLRELGELPQKLYVIPEGSEDILNIFNLRESGKIGSLHDVFGMWAGRDWVFIYDDSRNMPPRTEAPIASRLEIGSYGVRRAYSRHAIQFLVPPWNGHPLLLQEELTRRTGHNIAHGGNVLLEKCISDPESLSVEDFVHLGEVIRGVGPTLNIGTFEAPFQMKMGYGWDWLNSRNKKTLMLLQCFASILLAQREKKIAEAQIGRVKDTIDRLPFGRYPHLSKWSQVGSIWEELQQGARNEGLIRSEPLDRYPVEARDFVDGTLGGGVSGELGTNYISLLFEFHALKKQWGMVTTESPLGKNSDEER